MGHRFPPLEGEVDFSEMSQSLTEVGRFWAASQLRPRLLPEVKVRWKLLVAAWIDSELPLVVRKSGEIRGATSTHNSGRRLVFCDNSPAQWTFSRALEGETYSIDKIRSMLERDEIPFSYVVKRTEKPEIRYQCTLSKRDNLNTKGWKLCHVCEVGLRSRVRPADMPFDSLVEHFRRLIDPGNQFLVPLSWAGLGELPEVIEAIRSFESPECAR